MSVAPGATVQIAAARPYQEDGAVVVERVERDNVWGRVGDQRVRFFVSNLRFIGRQPVIADEHVIHEANVRR